MLRRNSNLNNVMRPKKEEKKKIVKWNTHKKTVVQLVCTHTVLIITHTGGVCLDVSIVMKGIVATVTYGICYSLGVRENAVIMQCRCCIDCQSGGCCTQHVVVQQPPSQSLVAVRWRARQGSRKERHTASPAGRLPLAQPWAPADGGGAS